MKRIISLKFIASISLAVLIVSSTLSAAQDRSVEKLTGIVGNLYALGRTGEGVALAEAGLTVAERQFGKNDSNIATILNVLAGGYRELGRKDDAERAWRRAMKIVEDTSGSDAVQLAPILNNFAKLLIEEDRLVEATTLADRSLAIREQKLGKEHQAMFSALDTMIMLNNKKGARRDNDAIYRRIIALYEKRSGPLSPDIVREATAYGQSLEDQGRYEEAEPYYRRALSIREQVLGLNHPNLSDSLQNISGLLANQGRFDEAGSFAERALKIDTDAFGPNSGQVAKSLSALAIVRLGQHDFAEGARLMKQAIEIYDKVLGPESGASATMRQNLAGTLAQLGELQEAESEVRKAIDVFEKSNNRLMLGAAYGALASIEYRTGRAAEAEAHYLKALEYTRATLGDDSLGTYLVLDSLAGLFFEKSDWTSANRYYAEAASMVVHHFTRRYALGQAQASDGSGGDQRFRSTFEAAIKSNFRADDVVETNAARTARAFEYAQWGQASAASNALAQMSARGAITDENLSKLVRERQDLALEWQEKNKSYLAFASQSLRDQSSEAQLRDAMAKIDARMAEIDRTLNQSFPQYMDYANPSATTISEIQTLLGPDEAMIGFFSSSEKKPTTQETFVWIVTKDKARWVRSDVGTEALGREVAALRCGLDFEGSWLVLKSRCPDLLKVEYTKADDEKGKPLPFDLTRSYSLYKALFGQFEDTIKDKHHLLIVPSGALTQLPFQVLVTDPPPATGYRDARWLIRKHAISILPAVSSLKSLRKLGKGSQASDLFIGFGNPLLDGDPASEPDPQKKEAILKAASAARAFASCGPSPGGLAASPERKVGTRTPSKGRGGRIDIEYIRRQEPIPETASELCDVARDLGSDTATHVYLGAKATKTELRLLSESGVLAKSKIVQFATHGAIAGDISPTSEPGLILTPPARDGKASGTDDGYLSASDIAALRLDADWVILSACNTAAGEAAEAEALSGLARAFFYAGARSLLVSHWEVDSDATVKLITSSIAELRVDPATGRPRVDRADALRRAMLSMIDTGDNRESHPAVWAPFVLVGEGAAPQ
ncbi:MULTISPECIES: CHAT domain-containing protein [unclassified Bradyrhizobium]|uniref:CHAT domain-containing tetratricopeptide repeat protein n=1 Tax=unclassified Bradyrhizobium TaxID=2631580 RepID=UPI001FF8CC03|nr:MULTISPECIES: CHAT domain-containing protein [unclassified Bradyrhizobium]MCK1267243.1 CHAT domain-containing protein [Bradyrhizobium sp. 84]MCK1374372.1 CHAT domain-containing protein [Bradyrhizobium sp. 49]MCK1428997.1 CHAT domain-containing protein [Bradyrhizobium sp. 87]